MVENEILIFIRLRVDAETGCFLFLVLVSDKVPQGERLGFEGSDLLLTLNLISFFYKRLSSLSNLLRR